MRDGGAEAGQQEQTREDRDPGSVTHSLSPLSSYSLPFLSTENARARAVCCKFTFQDGSSLELVAATVGRECNIKDARGRGLCYMRSGQNNLKYNRHINV